MFWTIVLLLAWYNTGLLVCLFMCWLQSENGEDVTTEDIKVSFFVAVIGWICVLLAIWYYCECNSKRSTTPKRIILKGKGRE